MFLVWINLTSFEFLPTSPTLVGVYTLAKNFHNHKTESEENFQREPRKNMKNTQKNNIENTEKQCEKCADISLKTSFET